MVFLVINDVLNQVEYLSKTKNQNTLIDTSSLAIHLNGLLEESVNRVGSERILFGTDLPLHFPESMLNRITKANLPINIIENIIYYNAIKYFPKFKEVF